MARLRSARLSLVPVQNILIISWRVAFARLMPVSFQLYKAYVKANLAFWHIWTYGITGSFSYPEGSRDHGLNERMSVGHGFVSRAVFARRCRPGLGFASHEKPLTPISRNGFKTII